MCYSLATICDATSLLQGGMDIVPVRLKNAVLRIVSRSKHRAYYLPQKEQPPGASNPAHVCASSGSTAEARMEGPQALSRQHDERHQKQPQPVEQPAQLTEWAALAALLAAGEFGVFHHAATCAEGLDLAVPRQA